jgi:hypothetical protein
MWGAKLSSIYSLSVTLQKIYRTIYPHFNHIFDDWHLSPDQWMKISFIPYCYNKGVQYLYLGFS